MGGGVEGGGTTEEQWGAVLIINDLSAIAIQNAGLYATLFFNTFQTGHHTTFVV